jgi:uncharacterized protein with ATP-grasp and redox domains
MATEDSALQEEILREAMALTSRLDFSKPPPFIAREIYTVVRNICGNSDPFKKIKHRCNELALSLYPDLEKLVDKSPDPLLTSTKIAIAGNIIDFGVNSDLDNNDIHRSIEDAIKTSLPESEMERFRRSASQARKILYIGDNAGEIVFDKLLIKQLLPQRITYAVRGFPIINDATREDAEKAGLSNFVKIIDSGSDIPGTVLDQCSRDFIDCYNEADLVIAKGQGNYETLNDENKQIFFMMKAKCPVVSEDIGYPLGSAVIMGVGIDK